MLTIGVVFGGCSVEHEISILSALQVMASIDKAKYKVIPIYLTKNNTFTVGKNFDKLETFEKGPKTKAVTFSKDTISRPFYKKKLDCVISCVHGKGVEGGELAGFFEINNIPYTSIGVLGASLGQDKILFKDVLKAHNVDVVPYYGFSLHQWKNEKETVLENIDKLQYPLIIKASSLGSSIGINRVKTKDELENAIIGVLKYDDRVLAEEMIEDFTEYNCSIIGLDTLSLIEEVTTENDILTFSDKYEGTLKAKRVIPAKISSLLEEKIYELTKLIANLINNKGVIRIDYLFDIINEALYVNEVNTIPGSFAYYLYEGKGIYFDDLIDSLIKEAIKVHHFKNQLINTFTSNVLNMKGIKK